jgi:hypothetical protein
MSPASFLATSFCSGRHAPRGESALRDAHITLNSSQRQRLLVTCKHIDKLLEDVDATLNAAQSESIFGNYVDNITPEQRQTIKEHVACIRRQLLTVLAGQLLEPEPPRISAAHSIYVNLTFIEIAITELAPRYMRGYGPVSKEGIDDLGRIVAQLQSSVGELTQYVLRLDSGDFSEGTQPLLS